MVLCVVCCVYIFECNYNIIIELCNNALYILYKIINLSIS